MTEKTDDLVSLVRLIAEQIENDEGLRQLLLANGVMFGEIAAPTFEEETRIRFMSDRFTESGLSDISVDEAGNAIARVPGKTGKRTVCLIAHADTVFPSSVDHAMAVQTDRVTGPGIARNSLGLASVAVMPILLEKLEIELDADLYLIGTTRNFGRGDLGGIRFFLDHFKQSIDQAICIEAVRGAAHRDHS